MHAATGTAWDEAAERYEGWLQEAIELIRGGGSNLFPEEEELLGDLHGPGGRSTCNAPAAGTPFALAARVAEVAGVDLSPRMIDLAERLTAATGAPATGSSRTSSTRRIRSTAPPTSSTPGRGSLLWLQDLDAWAAVVARLLVPGGRLVLFEGHPFEWLVDGDDDGHWALTDYDYFAGPEASRGWSPGFIDHPSSPTASSTGSSRVPGPSPRVQARENFQCCWPSGIERWSMKPGDQPRDASGPAK